MKVVQLLGTVALATTLQGCAHLETSSAAAGGGVALEDETAIPFANQRSAIQAWQVDGDSGLWVQDARREWYYAKLAGPCLGIEHAIRLGFDTGSSDRLDRFSHVIVPGESRCAIISFTKSVAPPDGKRHAFDRGAK